MADDLSSVDTSDTNTPNISDFSPSPTQDGSADVPASSPARKAKPRKKPAKKKAKATSRRSKTPAPAAADVGPAQPNAAVGGAVDTDRAESDRDETDQGRPDQNGLDQARTVLFDAGQDESEVRETRDLESGEEDVGSDPSLPDGPGQAIPSSPGRGATKAATKKRSRRRKGDAEQAEAPVPAVAVAAAEIDEDDEPAEAGPASEMIINYTPGEECRIAILEEGKLEEFNSEPTEHVSRVGNIYVGKVVNIERNIQAAFVDFGTEEAGFLHVSDLHPRYFPGADEDETERVGRKTPRRARPPIEQALRKGQEITVQVLKEGVGTKGPTLTSYLSIPGRFLVMMPDMDKVGVSRKVEDEDERRKMRQILDQLELPDGFGFILRTAGMERTKAELKRDLAYLLRLWKDMERRRRKSGGARLLYSESDLLLRTIRDRATKDVTRIVIDNEAALRRAGAFLKIVSPRAATVLCQYVGARPIFHAFGVEEQLDLMHATEVPLPSGGRLIIEQTEALVAIDVNSGKSRAAKDAESNAFKTNLEAVDEICRQLRLRDLGGLVINDLIDMRHASNRKEIENRFRERLKRDRARSTILPISQFGILEMTRQRMRGSFEQQHFQTCPRCTGRGLIQRPDSVAAAALRDLAALLEHDRVQRVELVVSPLVAGALLSTRRGTLGRIERLCGKKVDVRVSETIASGRVTMYAYDANGSDIDLERLPRTRTEPNVIQWEDTDLAPATDGWAVDLEDEAETVRTALEEEATAHERAAQEKIAHLELPGDDEADDEGKKKRKRRRRRKRKGDEAGADQQSQDRAPPRADEPRPAADIEPDTESDDEDEQDDGGEDHSSEAAQPGKKKRRRRRRRRRGDEPAENATVSPPAPAEKPEPRRAPEPPAPTPEPAPEKRKRRALYGAGRRVLSASERASADRE